VHAASHHTIKDFESKPELKAKKNVLMVQNLIEFSKKNEIKNFIYFSTIDLKNSPYPVKIKIYCQSKLLCEKILLSALKKKIFEKIVILRIPSIVKKNSGENFIINALYKLKNDMPLTIWNGENEYNNMIHINDLSKLIFYLIQNTSKVEKKIINCLSSKPIVLKKLVNYVVKKFNSKSKINFITKKNNFKRIKSFSRSNYKFFKVKKVIDLLI
jgi:nucleoside-diphosphate-sugar epimerase